MTVRKEKIDGDAPARVSAGLDRANSQVYLIDDEPEFRASVRFLLESEGLQVQDFASTNAFLKLEELRRPSCILLDLRLGDENGVDGLLRMRQSAISVPVVIVTAVATVAETASAFRAGAFDLIEKPYRKEELLAILRRAFQADDKAWKEQLRVLGAERRFARLSSREWDVLDLLVTGLRNKEIADVLGLAPKTVECHRAHLMSKTEAKSLGELASMYWQTPSLQQIRMKWRRN